MGSLLYIYSFAGSVGGCWGRLCFRIDGMGGNRQLRSGVWKYAGGLLAGQRCFCFVVCLLFSTFIVVFVLMGEVCQKLAVELWFMNNYRSRVH